MRDSLFELNRLESRRLLAHVGIDVTFGETGRAFAGGGALVQSLPDGDIISVSSAVVRLNADGTLDTQLIPPGTDLFANYARIKGDRLLLSGMDSSIEGYSAVIRALDLKTGSDDPAFDSDGVVTFTIEPGVKGTRVYHAYIASMIATSDGGVMISVVQSLRDGIDTPAGEASLLHKFTADGKPDPNFGNKGAILLQSQQYISPANLAALPNGQFLVLEGGRLTRRNGDGNIDRAFGENGFALVSVSAQFPYYEGPVIQPDGKILVIVTDDTDLFAYGHLARLNADGSVDASFGEDGSVSFGQDSIVNVAVDSRSRIVGVHSGDVFRLTPAGAFDTSFDDDGRTPISGYYPAINVDSLDRILLGSPDHVARVAPRERVEIGRNHVLHIDGDNNSDTISATLAGDSIQVTLNGQTTTHNATDVTGLFADAFDGQDRINLAVDLDATVNGHSGDDSLTTAAGADSINCGDGDDTVEAGGGRDLVFGGEGGDYLMGGAGDDRMFGDLGDDSLSGGEGNDRLYGGVAVITIYTDVYDGNDSLSGNSGNDRIDGQGGNDRVAGNGGRDRLFGGDDSDRIYGGVGGDWLYGGQGADRMYGEGGLDRLYADDEEQNGYTDMLSGGTGNDVLVSRDNTVDYLFGDRGGDSAYADDDDVLTGIEVTT